MENVEVVRQIYECFGRGDIAAILGRLRDDVEWEYGLSSTDVPWLQPRHGRDEVVRFFEALGGLEFHRFEAHTILAAEDTVVALIDLEATVRATGARIREEDEVHIWHFRDGAVARFRHRVDTQQHQQAFRPQSASAATIASPAASQS